MLRVGRVLVAVAVFAPFSFAGALTTITSLGSLGATDFIDWGQLGPDLTDVPGPLTVTSNLGETVTVANGTSDFLSVQQSNTWGGNFLPGEHLIVNQAGGTYTITFATPIQAAGMQFQSLDFGAFIATITAFGAGNTNFGTVTANGTSDSSANGSAVFLGVQSSAMDIVALHVDVQMNSLDDPFANNMLSFAGQVTALPEPSTMALGGAGLLLGILRRRRAA